MDEKLILEIEAILIRYNVKKSYDNAWMDYDEDIDTYKPISIEDFEENIDWDWVSKNYHVSHAFIYEYQDKLNMKYLYDNYVITKEDFEKICKKEIVDNRFEIMDL